MKRNPPSHIERRVALCYIRLSQTKNESDLKSPERQRANLQAACDKYGWIPEWYADAEKHKSGTKESNRPQWLLLKARVNDPDVAVLAVNDTSRAMRNTWRALKLFDELSSSDVKLYVAVSDRMMDIKTPDGRMSLFMQAFIDEMYALDGSRRASDSIRHRKSRQITVGMPPFGTVRNAHGYLIPSGAGAWKLPAGGWQGGESGGESPVEGAVWRSYHDAARRVLELYAENKGGYSRIAKSLTREGWAFRDRWGIPRLFSSDDVRRVVANWREYAGIVTDGRAKERVAHETEDNAAVLYDTGRAVFSLDLLRRVARVQEQRSVTTRPTGSVDRVYPYGLLRLLYCARCEAIAREEGNLRRRSRLSGTNMDRPRYRHAEGVRCGCTRRSVRADQIEGDFLRLVQLMTLKPEAHQLMLELALRTSQADVEREGFEAERRAAIAVLKQQLANLLDLYKNAVITAEEFYRDRGDRERQIAFWEARTTDHQKKALELEHVMAAFSRLIDLWADADSDERSRLAASLFEYLVVDLDDGRIVDFRLHPWADQYLCLRAELFDDDDGPDDPEDGSNGHGELEGTKNRFTTPDSDEAIYDPNGRVFGRYPIARIRLRIHPALALYGFRTNTARQCA
ncbi:MAG: recombinase family protein [Chloroflexi bacterium]|nr:recombinase family protein [Chloroflexota bacterium]